MAEDNYDQKYTDPELRRQLKEEILESDKGGQPGQWSARKSQLLVKEYEKKGGGYKKADKDEAAQSLEKWSEQDWQTQEGEDRAREDGVTKRYLPKAVWDKLSDAEKQEAEQSKEKASKEGKQQVEWTPAIEKAMAEVEHESHKETSKQELYEQAKSLNIKGRSNMTKDELMKAIDETKN
ncbi:Rho termination factor N-terminal domain-containing protein [Fortiea sp. LEGE XX443]|uniref:Rho termination factor N-terminal domain-containing protein n=1 Tax=Fortiea sp. LEGE XX443 TaxID=1828611 RepID=UPI0018809D66|nr:Rho termination factor N-terminal domain-containing protein [Fortiea sp. LEGE XX443]MBE9005713.1 Rho termination factor N-terminal domain-containing protein [Fortiea sp. LEGE XX443]